MLSLALEKMGGLGTVAGVMAVLLILMMWGLYAGFESDRHWQKTNGRALELWLADCKKPIEDCASDWQFNYTLRQIYLGRVSKANGADKP